MSGPPAVTVSITGGGLDGPIAASCALLLVLTMAGLFACGAAQIPADLLYILSLSLCSLCLVGFCVAWIHAQASPSVLRWDGQHWYCSRQDGDSVCAARCVLDLQVWMLLRLQIREGPSEWMWLQRKEHVKGWYPLRRALIFDAVSAHDRPALTQWDGALI